MSNKRFSKVVIILIAIVALVVVLFPFILDSVYKLDSPISFFNVEYTVGELLSYYGSALIFFGTASISIVALYQNKIANEASLKMEGEQYKHAMEKENNEFTPRFEITNYINNRFYSNLQFEITNITQKNIFDLTALSFEVLDEKGDVIKNSVKTEFSRTTLKPGDSIFINAKLDELKYMEGQKECSYRNITLYFEFSCKDEKGDEHKYSASLYIPDTNYGNNKEWEVKELNE